MLNELLPALLFLLSPLAPSTASAGTVIIYHTGDVHGRYSSRAELLYGSTVPARAGGFAALSAIAKTEKDPVLLLDSGDWYTGTPEGDLTRGLASVRLMNAAGYAASALGNHEFDHGMQALEAAVSSANFKVLGANIYKDGGNVPYAAPFAIVKAGGVKLAIIGITNQNTPELTIGDVQSLSFAAEKETLLKVLPEVEKLGAAAVIVLLHDGIYTGDVIDGASWQPPAGALEKGSLALARAAAGRVQVILGGHMHTLLSRGYRDPVTGTLIGESGHALLYASRVELTFDDKTGKFTGASDRAVPLLTATAGEDPAVLAALARLEQAVSAGLDAPIGEAAADIPRGPRGPEFTDSPLGSLFCDMIRAYAGTQAAVQNTEGLRAGLHKGRITFRDLYEITPYDGLLVTARLSGARLRALLAEGISDGDPELQVSGIELEYGRAKDGKPMDLSVKIGGKPLEADSYYTVAINDFFLRSPRWREFVSGEHETREVIIRDIMVSGIQKAGAPLTPPAPGRMRMKS
jgi:2',3'-cyclic-nucleotide 2'-phosphodiesterase (5'-nucleotidase family)